VQLARQPAAATPAAPTSAARRTKVAKVQWALLASLLCILGLLAASCGNTDTGLRPTPAQIAEVSAPQPQAQPTTAQVTAPQPAPTPTSLAIPAVTGPLPTGPPTEYVLYNETAGFRGSEPGNELVLASFDDRGEMTVWHTWPNSLLVPEGSPAYLTDQGNLLIAGTTPDVPEVPNIPIGSWSTLRLLAGDGTVLWEHVDCDPSRCLHHDIEPLPNGNVLVFVYYRIAADQAAQYGIDSVDGIWMDEILELRPIFGADAATECDGAPWCTDVVWEWDTADHVVIPEADGERSQISPRTIDLRTSDGGVDGADPIHFNGMDYNQDLAQIAVSSFSLSEIYIIDRGGSDEILYRWGRPSNYGQSGSTTLGHQHDARWIDDATLSVMNNNSPFGQFLFDVPSEVLTLSLPTDGQGSYSLGETGYGPEQATVVVDRAREPRLNAPFMSGATVRPDGSAMVSLSLSKELASIDSSGATNWLVRLPGPGGQFWKAQLLAPSDPAVVELVQQVGELTPSRHRCHLTPSLAECQPPADTGATDNAGNVDGEEAELAGADRTAPTAVIDGIWQLTVTGPNGALDQALEVFQGDDGIGQRFDGFLGTSPINGSIEGNVVTFTGMLDTPFGELPAAFELIASEQSLEGIVTLDGLPVELPPQQVRGVR